MNSSERIVVTVGLAVLVLCIVEQRALAGALAVLLCLTMVDRRRA